MKHVFDENGITYRMYDNSFFEISDLGKAQESADKFDSKALCRQLDFFVHKTNPYLDTIEKTINDPKEYKVYKDVHHRDGSFSKRWVPMGKSIANLYRYAEISKAANKRFLDSLCNVVPRQSLEKEVNAICEKKTQSGQTAPGFNGFLLGSGPNRKIRTPLFLTHKVCYNNICNI